MILKRLFFLFKILISFLILYAIFKHINIPRMLQYLRMVSPLTLTGILLLAVLKWVIQCYNWGKFLALNPQYEIRTGEVVRSFLIGEALRFLVPGGYATYGKMFYVNNRKSATIISVSMEKFFIIWTSLLFAALAGIFYFTSLALYIRIVVFFIIMSMPGWVYLIPRLFPGKSLYPYSRKYNEHALVIISAQIIFMIITLVQYYLIITSVQSFRFLDTFISVPLILIANIIPITYSGLGLREHFAVLIFTRYNMVPEAAIVCSMLIFLVNNVITGIMGVVLLLRSRNHRISIAKTASSNLIK